MVTWLFSARHWLASNYGFPSGAQQCVAPYFQLFLKEDSNTAESTKLSNVRACVFACNCTHSYTVCWLVRPVPRAQLRLRRLVCGPVKVFPSFIDAVEET